MVKRDSGGGESLLNRFRDEFCVSISSDGERTTVVQVHQC